MDEILKTMRLYPHWNINFRMLPDNKALVVKISRGYGDEAYERAVFIDLKEAGKSVYGAEAVVEHQIKALREGLLSDIPGGKG